MVTQTETTAAKTEPTRHGPPDVVRFLLDVLAVLPLVIFGVVDMARGWRPLFDNAAIAFRSYQVFSRNTPLVGHQVALYLGSRPVYSPGPLENWLLAVPVRLDPNQGALWGAVLFAGVGVTLAIEAAWSTARWWGAVAATTSVLVLFAVRGDVVVDVVWNPWFGVIWLYTTLASSWATATGRLRWWPVAVISASVVAQCHEVFALPAIEVALTAAILGVMVRRSRRDPVGLAWLTMGAAGVVIVWIAPVIQQLTSSPGNFTVLWRVAHQSGAGIGLSQALSALAGSSGLVPKWVHPPPLHSAYGSFLYIVNIFEGGQWWAVTALVLLMVITVTGLTTGRYLLAGLGALSFVVALGTARAIATVPKAQFLNFAYLDVILIPVGTMVWLTLAWTLVEVARPAIGRALDRLSWHTKRLQTLLPNLVTLGGVIVVGATFGWSLVSGITLEGTDASTIGGWAAVQATDAGVSAAARLAPHVPFRLQLAEPSNDYRYAVVTGVAYLLDTKGFQPRLTGLGSLTFGEASPEMQVVVLHVPGPGVRVWASVGE